MILHSSHEVEASTVQNDDAVEPELLGRLGTVGGVDPGWREDGEHTVQGNVEKVDALEDPTVERHTRVVQVGVVGEIHCGVL